MPPIASFTPEATAALDLAKRAVPEGGQLTPELLLAAACHAAALEDSAPDLVSRLPAVVPVRDVAPDRVAVAEPLRPLLKDLAGRSEVTLETMVSTLLASAPVRDYLTGRGVPATAVDSVIQTLGGRPIQAPARPSVPTQPSTPTQPSVPTQVPVSGAEPRPTAESAPLPTPPAWRTSSEREAVLRRLAPWGRVLTRTAPAPKGVMKMDTHLRSLQKNLLKMRRPNALIIGQPGTGKTALVYEFARLIIEGDPKIAPTLRDRDVFELSVSLFRAGAGIVGEYEKRVGELIRIFEEHPQVILFVDEIHQMLTSGIHEGGPFSQGDQAFKQAIGRGAFSIIGATTVAEYAHYIAPDGALSRRFGTLRIEPPTPAEALEILRGRAPQFRAHYAPLVIEDEILDRVVELSEDLLPTRFQPDKALDVLDEACAVCIMHAPPLPAVTEAVLQEAIEDEIGHSVVRPGSITADTVTAELRTAILGQEEATEEIARGFVAGMSHEWLQHNGPRRIFFFCGPTGTGKTETARRLATILGGGREAMIRVDCNTLMGSAGADPGPIMNRLLGVHRGYIGYARGEGGLLSKIRDMPESIVLFDEIEKASAHIGKLLLQILDEGRTEDNDGNLLDFRRAFVIFTTNAGARYGKSRAGQVGFFGDDLPGEERIPTVTVEAVKEELRTAGYGEEFFGRQIDFVVFKGLTKDVVEQVLRQQLQALQGTARDRGFTLDWTEEIFERLLTGWTPRVGARFAFTILQERVEEQLALAEIEGQLAGVTRIHLDLLPLAPRAGAPAELAPGAAPEAPHGEVGPEAEIGRVRRTITDGTLVIYVA